MNTTVLTQATIIDGTGRDPIPSGSVELEGDRIKIFQGGTVYKNIL